MFVVIFFLLGLCCGFAARMPWALLAFVIPGLLALAATNRSYGAVLLGFAVTAAGLLVGFILAQRSEQQSHRVST